MLLSPAHYCPSRPDRIRSYFDTSKLRHSLFLVTFIFLMLPVSSHCQNLDRALHIRSNTDVIGTGIDTDNDGNLYAIGYYENTAIFGTGDQAISLTNAGADATFITKSAETGEVLWAKRIISNTPVLGTDIAIDQEGNSYITGLFTDTIIFASPEVPTLYGESSDDVFVIKVDTEGNFVWAKAFVGSSFSAGRSIAVNENGSVVVTGRFSGVVDFNPGLETFELTSEGIDDAFVVKLNTDGDFIWAKAFLGPQSNIGEGIAIDADGNVYTTGRFAGTAEFDPGDESFELSTVSGSAVFVSKLDAQGDFVWARQFAGNGSNGFDIAIDGEGNIISCGRFIATQDFDPGPDQFILSSEGSFDSYVSKLDNDGSFLWAKQIGGSSPDSGLSLDVDGSGSVYVTGFFFEEASILFESGEESITGAGNRDVFLSKLNANGNFEWAFPMGGTESDAGKGISVDGNGNIYTLGEFEATAQFNSAEFTALGETDAFITVHAQPLNTSDYDLQIEPLLIYPNPAANSVQLSWKGDINAGVLEVIDMSGKTVSSETVRTNPHFTDVTNIAPGFYLLRFSEAERKRVYLGKLSVEN